MGDVNIKGRLREKGEMEKERKGSSLCFHLVSLCYKRKSETFASLLKWTKEENGEERGRAPCITSPSQQKLSTVKRTKTPPIRILQAKPFKVVRSLH